MECLSSMGNLRKRTTESALNNPYLELSEGETAAGADLAVVLDGRASDNRTELVDGAGSQSGGLGLTGSTAGSLLASLEIPIMSITTFSKHWCRRNAAALRGFGSGKNRIPGRSACVHDAASPCGSLFRILSQSLIPLIIRLPSVVGGIAISSSLRTVGGICSRFFTIFWLCLIAC